MMNRSRREFLKASAGGGALLSVAGMAQAAEQHSLADNHLCVFNKPLQHMDYAA